MAADSITKILVRRGTDGQRKFTNTTGIKFDLGEPAFTVDTKRLYVGDGTSTGGIPVGIRNLGTIFSLFDGDGITNEAARLFALSGLEVGDIIYETSTKSLYTLSAFTFSEPVRNDFVRYEFQVGVNPGQLEYNADGLLQIRIGGVGIFELNSAICEPGGGLAKPYISSGISITNDGVINTMLNKVPGNTVKANPTRFTSNPSDIEIGPGQLLGRTFTKDLSGINYVDLIREVFGSALRPINGVGISNLIGSSVTQIGLSASHFEVYPHEIHIMKPLRVDQGDFYVLNGNAGINAGDFFVGGNYNSTGSIAIDGGVRCGTVQSNIILNNNSIRTSTLNADTADIMLLRATDIQSVSLDNMGNIKTNTLTSTVKVQTNHVQTNTFESNSINNIGSITAGGNVTAGGNIIAGGNLSYTLNLTGPTATIQTVNSTTGNIQAVNSSTITNSGLITTNAINAAGAVITGSIDTGSINNTNNIITGGTITCGGTLTCTGVIQSTGNDVVAYSTSDSNLKKNIVKINNPLDTVSKISGYNFEWNSAEEKYSHLKGEDVGVLAEEIEKVIPSAVITRPDGVKAVNYTKLIPLLIESIKELKTKLEK